MLHEYQNFNKVRKIFFYLSISDDIMINFCVGQRLLLNIVVDVSTRGRNGDNEDDV